METQKERLIQVRRRTPAEVWDKAIAEYLAGARASEVAAKYGVSAHSIYQRVSGRGKKARQSAVGNRQSGGAEQHEQRAQHPGGGDTNAPPARGPARTPALHIACAPAPLVEGAGEAGAFLAG